MDKKQFKSRPFLILGAILFCLVCSIFTKTKLFWKIENGKLQLWGDEPYTQSYAVDYLNIDRSTRSQVGLATQVGTINAGAGTNGGTSNSSQTSLLNTAEHHFWAIRNLLVLKTHF